MGMQGFKRTAQILKCIQDYMKILFYSTPGLKWVCVNGEELLHLLTYLRVCMLHYIS